MTIKRARTQKYNEINDAKPRFLKTAHLYSKIMTIKY